MTATKTASRRSIVAKLLKRHEAKKAELAAKKPYDKAVKARKELDNELLALGIDEGFLFSIPNEGLREVTQSESVNIIYKQVVDNLREADPRLAKKIDTLVAEATSVKPRVGYRKA